MIDIDIKIFCNCKLNKHDRPNQSMLDNARKSHVRDFNDKVNELINTCQLKQCVVELKHMSNEQTHNKINDMSTKVLTKARSAVEGLTRILPFSKKNLQTNNEFRHWKVKAKKLLRKRINVERMNCRLKPADFIDNTTLIEGVEM